MYKRKLIATLSVALVSSMYLLTTGVKGVSTKKQPNFEVKKLAVGIPVGKSLQMMNRGGYDFLSLTIVVQEGLTMKFLHFRTVEKIHENNDSPPMPPPAFIHLQKAEALLDWAIREKRIATFFGTEVQGGEYLLTQVDWGSGYLTKLR